MIHSYIIYLQLITNTDPSSDVETGREGDKGPIPVRKDNVDPASGKESVKGSSPADFDFASSGMYAGSSKSDNKNWGDLEDD